MTAKQLCPVCAQAMTGGTGLGNIIVCRICYPRIREVIDDRHARGLPVDVSTIARDLSIRLEVRLPAQLHRWLKLRAAQLDVSMNDLAVEALESYVRAKGPIDPA